MMLGANCDLRVVPVDAADGRIDHQPLVLVVDDDAQLRNLLARWLRAAGYPVQVAGTAEEALVTQLMTPVAVAVCDIGLPGEDGVWLATQFRERFPDTAVVMMTGAADVDSAVAGVRLGVVDYLRKPLDRVRVCAAVARGIGRDHGWTAHDRHPGRGETETGKEAPQAPGIDRLLSTIARCHADAVERTRRVGNLAIVLARRLRIPDAGLCVIGQAALLYKLRSLVPAAAPEPSRYAASTEDVVGGVEERFDGRGPRGAQGRGDLTWQPRGGCRSRL